MKLLTLEMFNIRSYEHQIIQFPDGSFLLSGDIGFGKSTILLAIEFALFGLGDITASSLLRRGEREGKVRLEFELNGKNIVVSRGLQKKGESISQVTGYISIDGIRKEMTPTELKAEIISLLGYPKELSTKQKNPIYRYTVYTPQEEMKQILLSKREDRMEILRRIFGVDRYKIIRDNSNTLRLDLKRKAFSYEQLSRGLNERNNELKEIKEKKERLGEEIAEINKSLNEIKTNESFFLKKSEEIDEKYIRYQNLSNEIAIKESEYNTYENNYTKLNLKLNQLIAGREGIDIEKEILLIEEDNVKIMEEITKCKEKKEELNHYNITLGKIEVELSNKRELFEKNSKEIALKEDLLSSLKGSYDTSIDELKREIAIAEKNIEYTYQKKEGFNKDLDLLIKSRERYNTKILEYKEKNSMTIGRLKTIESDMYSLNNLKGIALCPLCKQSISDEHRQNEIKRMDEEKNKLLIDFNQTNELIKKVELKIKKIDSDIDNKIKNIISSEKNKIIAIEQQIRETESFNGISKELDSLFLEKELLEKIIENKSKEQKQILDEIKKFALIDTETLELESRKDSNLDLIRNYKEALNIRKDIEAITTNKSNLFKEINVLRESVKKYSDIHSEKQKINQELIQISDKKIKKEREEAEKSKELYFLGNDLQRISNEIKEKKKNAQIKEKLEKMSYWIDNYFINLMEIMEREFMESLRVQFESYFSKWLESLLEGNDIEASIDEDFTPILRQEGFDADYDSLSGGERTSVALAYRLALNRVINNLIDEIKTQDLIILDEPTDGFSRKQLDKVRDVLDMLGMDQVIIVSHEPEIESYVDHVLRVTKRDGISRIECQPSSSKPTVGLL
ncbi:MAG: SMC family ATPase [Candidatus Methanofastidiosa archaeon]|nr:SMC family ATPase [Candidatus Methanofastidiosa archaeon]HOM96555.1 SMC family ATPase [Methanofastidiosum sp.]HPC81187.1 SMC family ATPase [Methanofastidiosum sp.]HRS26127.1 SMC family ATPase [Methanofastidiosum sp.]